MPSIRRKVRTATFITAALLICAGFAWKGTVEANRCRSALEASYLRAAEDLAAYSENIAAALEKAHVTGTPEQLNRLTAKLWKESAAAKSALSQLPTSQFNLENTWKFLSQVGEYAVSLSQKAADGQKITDEEAANFRQMAEYSKKLEKQMLLIQNTLQTGETDFLSAVSAGMEAPPNFAEDLAEFEEGFTAYPTLIYDGPFSDHLLQKNPEMLKSAEEISRAKARETAARCFNVDSGKILNNGDEEGSMPSFCFTFGEREISITRKGGFLTYLTDPRQPESRKLSPDEAVRKAENYLNWLGIPDMTMTYYEISGDILTANFAAVQGDFVAYTDLIKISVAMDDGGIVGYEARGYLTNHRERTLPVPAISAEEASRSISPRLTVKSVRMAIIPSDGQSERFCYEFRCKSDEEQDVLVYINCTTGREEQILLLLISEDGTLVI